MKKVLFITYYFPPSGGAGVQRVLKFVKYLPQNAWQPAVLTVNEDADFPARDDTLFSEIAPDLDIIRTPIFEPYNLYRRLTGRDASQPTDIASLENKRISVQEKFSEWIRSTFFIPDARCFWKGPAVRAGMRYISRNRPDIIVSSGPPYTCHLIGQALHRKTGIPWVADFRDSWVDWVSAPKRWSIPRSVDMALEGSVLREADCVLTVSDGVRDDLLSRHPQIDSTRFKLLPNGYDVRDFKDISVAEPQDRFTLTYTGSLYGKRNPLVLLEALGNLLKESPELKHVLRFRFVGRVDGQFLEAFNRYPDIIEYIPYVTHAESIAYLLNSSASLLIIDDTPANRGILTGKLYEYLGARRPILALAPEGEAVQLIHSLNAGKVAPPDNVEAVEAVLKAMIVQWKAGTLKGPDPADVSVFNRENQTGQLAGILNNLISNSI
ncbi:glycosyltransferase family 4 protein [bacterium]|nr:glycosyltransferase family 4 protein [bacterium]